MTDTTTDSAGTILVVDDDRFTAELTGMFIEMAGYQTVLAEGGLDALEQMEQNPAIRAVVSDMNMPIMDGIELFAQLREQGFRHPFLLLTGEDAAPLRLAHPAIDAILTKDENLQETLPELLEQIIAGS